MYSKAARSHCAIDHDVASDKEKFFFLYFLVMIVFWGCVLNRMKMVQMRCGGWVIYFMLTYIRSV